MTRPTDTSGASRRKPSEFGAETGLDIANDAPGPQRRQFQHKPRRVIPDCGCHGYDLHGVMYTRCEAHRPAGSRDCGPVRGACPECKPL